MTNPNLKFENNPAPGDKSSGFVIAPGSGFSIFGESKMKLFIKGHQNRRENHGNWKGGITNHGLRIVILNPNHHRADKKGYVRRSILVAEKALGKPLPHGAVVHHANGDCSKDENGNLVICQDQGYHLFLHQRKRAYEATGNPRWIKCPFCKKYDEPKNMYVYPNKTTGAHRECKAKHQRVLDRKKRREHKTKTRTSNNA